MDDLNRRLQQALALEEKKAERLAGAVRISLLAILTVVALLNVGAVSPDASTMNFAVLAAGYTYSLVVFLFLRRTGYRSFIKYVTSCTDILLIFVLLVLYASIEVPSVALKNYVFLVVYPIIAMTAFRYDLGLTLTTGGLAMGLYALLALWLTASGSVVLTDGGYDQELFSTQVTYIGQSTKILILGLFVALVAYLARYSRRLFTTLIHNELSVRGEKQLMDWEMKIASEVQAQFLPHEVPNIPGLAFGGAVRQGRAIGGDYYDFIRLPDESLLIIVADVSGKGVPAALIMAEVRASVQLLASMHSGLQELTQRLNTLIHQSTDKKSFVTFLAASIDARRSMMRYVSAGHLPPIISSRGTVRSLERGTLPLGLTGSLPGLTARTEPLTPGDLVVCFTDGIVERTDFRGEQYGEERLLDFVRTHSDRDVDQFIAQLFDQVSDFARGKEPDDDATVAVVRVFGALPPDA